MAEVNFPNLTGSHSITLCGRIRSGQQMDLRVGSDEDLLESPLLKIMLFRAIYV